MTVGQRIFHILDEKKMTQREFSKRTGIATTTISDWRKKNTNPGSEKIMTICAALEVTPEYLLTGICEDSRRGRDVEYMIVSKGTEERLLLDLYGDMDWVHRAHLIEYAKRIRKQEQIQSQNAADKGTARKKVADFCDIEVYMDSECFGNPSVDLYYVDDDVSGKADLRSGAIYGDFSKYVIPVIKAWLDEHREILLNMWENRKPELVPEWV